MHDRCNEGVNGQAAARSYDPPGAVASRPAASDPLAAEAADASELGLEDVFRVVRHGRSLT